MPLLIRIVPSCFKIVAIILSEGIVQQFLFYFFIRMECYKYITDILDELTAISETPPQPPSVPLGPGPPKTAQESSSVDGSHMTPEEAQSIVCIFPKLQTC